MAVWWQVTTWEDAEMPCEVTEAAQQGKAPRLQKSQSPDVNGFFELAYYELEKR